MGSTNPAILVVRAALRGVLHLLSLNNLQISLRLGREGCWLPGLEALLVRVEPLWKELLSQRHFSDHVTPKRQSSLFLLDPLTISLGWLALVVDGNTRGLKKLTYLTYHKVSAQLGDVMGPKHMRTWLMPAGNQLTALRHLLWFSSSCSLCLHNRKC